MGATGGTVALVNRGAKGLGDEAACQVMAERIREMTGAEVVFTRPDQNVTDLARRHAAHARTLIAAGGDGTVSAVASAVAGSDTVLGVIPLGTLNHFAKDFGIPTELDGALEVLRGGHVVAVDAAEVNGRVFVNNSGLGLYPAALAMRDEHREKGWRKWPALIWGGLKALGRFRLMTIVVQADGKEVVRVTPMVFVGNNHYTMHGFQLGSRERGDGGSLCLVIPHRTGRLRLTWFGLRALLGQRFPNSELDHIHAESVSIDAGHHRVRVSLDGELTKLRTPLEYRILPGALRVAVPAVAGD